MHEYINTHYLMPGDGTLTAMILKLQLYAQLVN